MMRKCFSILMAVLLLTACRGGVDNNKRSTTSDSVITEAKLIAITHDEGYTKVDITDPWNQGKILHTYVLVPSDKELPAKLPEGTVVRTPVKNVLVYSSVHSSVLRELGAGDAVRGVCDAQYFND